MARLAVVQVPRRNSGSQHFFQTNGLGAQFRFVAGFQFRLAAFIFHRGGLEQAHPPGSLTPSMASVNSTTSHTPDNPNWSRRPARRGPRSRLCGLIEGSSTRLCKIRPSAVKFVFLPLPFDVDERPLSAAKKEMLEARERKEFIGRVFSGHSPSITSYLRSGNSANAML